MAYDKTHMGGKIKPMGSGRGGFSTPQVCASHKCDDDKMTPKKKPKKK